MAFTPPNTFVDGQTLDPELWNENVRAIADYYNEGLDNGDITNGTILTKHINRPSQIITAANCYQVLFETETIARNCNPATDSGMRASASGPAPDELPADHMQQPYGFVSGTYQPAYYSKTNLFNAGNTESTVKDINKSGMTIVIPYDAKMVQIYYIGEFLPASGYGIDGVVYYIGINGDPIPSTLSYVNQVDRQADMATNNYNFNRRHFTISYLWKGPEGAGITGPTILNISLMGGSYQSAAFISKVTGIVEVIY